jgi:hypothetical protein
MTKEMPARRLGGRGSRNKGASFEREIARELRAVWPEAVRGLGQARAADEVPDVDVPGWWIECKRMRECRPQAALRQAEKAAIGSGRIPVAITRDDRDRTVVTLNLEDWIALVERADYGR